MHFFFAAIGGAPQSQQAHRRRPSATEPRGRAKGHRQQRRRPSAQSREAEPTEPTGGTGGGHRQQSREAEPQSQQRHRRRPSATEAESRATGHRQKRRRPSATEAESRATGHRQQRRRRLSDKRESAAAALCSLAIGTGGTAASGGDYFTGNGGGLGGLFLCAPQGAASQYSARPRTGRNGHRRPPLIL